MNVFRKMMKGFKSSEKAQGMVEYGLILALVSVVAVGAVGGVGDKVKTTFDNVVNGVGIVEEEGEEEVVKTYTVTFKDDKGNVIETIEVAEGENATPSKEPTRAGYTFKGWDKSFDKVTGDLEVKAQYKINTYTVKFLNADGSTLDTQTINYGENARLPNVPKVPISINTSDKWEGDVENITSDREVKFKYDSLVGTPEELQAIDDSEESRGKKYLQIGDIDMRSFANFESIGRGRISTFNGEYDGAGFVIKNLTVNPHSGTGTGLFGQLSGSATLKNIGLEDVSMNGIYMVGGLAGVNSGMVLNCYTTGNVDGDSHHFTGGLVGANYGTISNSYSTANVTGGLQVGGLLGQNNTGKVINGYATGSVTGDEDVGALIGSSHRSELLNSGWLNSNLKGIGKCDSGDSYEENGNRGLSKSEIDIEIKKLPNHHFPKN